jgi:hypothetical protein
MLKISSICDVHFLDAGMDQAKDAEIEGGVDERAEMMDGIMEEDFGTGDQVSDHSAFSGAEVPRTVIYMFSGSRSNSTVRSTQRDVVENLHRGSETIIRPPQ